MWFGKPKGDDRRWQGSCICVEQHGLPFEFYQATSSNSEDWKLPSTWSETAYASTNGATGADKATFAQRLASLLHRVAKTPSQSDR